MLSRNRATRKAFTLLELAIVLAILTVLLAAVAPRWSGAEDRHRLTAARDRLVEVLRTAQETAVVWGQDVSVQVPPVASQQMSLVVRTTLPDGSILDTDFGPSSIYRRVHISVYPWPVPQVAATNESSATTATFDARGRLANVVDMDAGLSFELTGTPASGTQKIVVGAMGNISSAAAAAAARDDDSF